MSKQMPAVTDNFCVGGDNRPANEQYFQGELYGVHVFSDLRTAEEVAQDYRLVTADAEDVLYSAYYVE